MLVLSRKEGQELLVGDDVRIVVTRISGSRVTLGILAPEEVRVLRGELEPIVRSFEAPLEPGIPGSVPGGAGVSVDTEGSIPSAAIGPPATR
jgi:carbon storage regulator